MNLSVEDFQAIALTLQLASVTTVLLLLLATPVAWWLAHTRSAWRAPVASLVALPLVLPPTVLGFYLLVALGPNGPIGQFTQWAGWGTLAFSFWGLVLGSVVYSLPFAVQLLVNAFEAMGPRPMEVIKKLGVQANVMPKLVQGDSIGQTYQFVSTENAQLGFVALSQISVDGRITQGSAWVVPQSMHTPLKQDAVLLNAGKNNAAAIALLKYLQADKAKTIIRQYGYAL